MVSARVTPIFGSVPTVILLNFLIHKDIPKRVRGLAYGEHY